MRTLSHIFFSKGHGHTSGSASGSSTPGFLISGSVTPDDKESINKEGTTPISEKPRRRFSHARAKLAIQSALQASTSTGLSKEHQEQGRVKLEVYKSYINATSKIGFGLFLLATIAQQVASVLSTLTLRYWGEHNREVGSNDGMFKYLLAYGTLSLSASILGGISAIIMWVYCALRSARKLHDSVSRAVVNCLPELIEGLDAVCHDACSAHFLRAYAHWKVCAFSHISTSTDLLFRVLNLFSRDTYVVDQILARVIQGLCRTVAVCLSILVVIGTSFPPFLLVVFPLGWFYLRVMK